MSSWDDIYRRLEAGARFSLEGMTPAQLEVIFAKSVTDDELEHVRARLVAEASKQQSNRELLSQIVAIVSGVTGIVVQARKVI